MPRGSQLPWYMPFLAKEGDAAGSGGAGSGSGDGEGDADERVIGQLRRLMQQHGGGEQALKVLFDDNLRIRGKYQRVRDQLTELKGKAPAEGDVVLKGEDAKAWAAIVALQVPVADVATRLKTATEAEAKLKTYERQDGARKAAELVGYDADVLLDRLDRDALHLEIVTSTEKVDGEDVTKQVPRVRKSADAAAQLQDLTAYTDQNWIKYKPSLLKSDAASEQDRTQSGPKPRPAPVTRSGEQRTPPTPSPDQLAEAALATGQYPRF